MTKAKNPLLWPPSILFRMITWTRNFMYDKGILHSEKFAIPVICIGNITVGGTGKTPHAEYVISILGKELKVALLSRGYMRKTRGFRYVSPSSLASESGDEPLQISRKFPDSIVAVDSDRINGIHTILREHPESQVIILDDGFQHRKVKPGLSILLTDYGRLMTRDSLLPFGRLRESASQRKRADVIIVTKTPDKLDDSERSAIEAELRTGKNQKVLFTTISYSRLAPVFEQSAPAADLPDEKTRNEQAALILTGIASPGPLITHLEKYFSEIRHLQFPDHHFFTPGDIEKITKNFREISGAVKMIITTEKDAVRLREFSNIGDQLKKVLYYIPAGVSFLKNDKIEFDKLLFDYARKNK